MEIFLLKHSLSCIFMIRHNEMPRSSLSLYFFFLEVKLVLSSYSCFSFCLLGTVHDRRAFLASILQHLQRCSCRVQSVFCEGLQVCARSVWFFLLWPDFVSLELAQSFVRGPSSCPLAFFIFVLFHKHLHTLLPAWRTLPRLGIFGFLHLAGLSVRSVG